MDNSFLRLQNKKEKRNGGYGQDFRRLNHSSSQPLFYHTKDSSNKSILLKKLKNNYNSDKKNLIFPYLNNNKNQAMNSIESSYHNNNSSIYTKNTDNSNKKSIRLKLIKTGVKNQMDDVKKKISKLIDDKLAAALGNKKMMEEIMKKRMIAKMRKRFHQELYRERSLDDLKLRREFDEIEKSRENIRQMRKKMLYDIKSRQIEDLENFITSQQQNMYMNPYSFIPPQFFLNPFNQDSTGDLMKFILFKRIMQEERDLIPLQYLSAMGFPLPMFYPPKPVFKIKRPKQRTYKISFAQPRPIIIKESSKFLKKKTNNKSTDSPKGIPFQDPLESYLAMIQKLRKKTQAVPNRADDDKKKSKSPKDKKEKDDEEDEKDDKESDEGDKTGSEEKSGEEEKSGSENNKEGDGDDEEGGEGSNNEEEE